MPLPLKMCSIGLLLLTTRFDESSVKVYSKETISSPFSEIELFEKVTRKGEHPTLSSAVITANGLAKTVTGRVAVAEHPTLFMAFRVTI